MLELTRIILLGLLWSELCALVHHRNGLIHIYNKTLPCDEQINSHNIKTLPQYMTAQKDLPKSPCFTNLNLTDDSNIGQIEEKFSVQINHALSLEKKQSWRSIKASPIAQNKKQHAGVVANNTTKVYSLMLSQTKRKRHRRFVNAYYDPGSGQIRILQKSGPDCPQSCHCRYSLDKSIDVVDCSDKAYTEIPRLPSSAREVYLQNNKIQDIPCGAFRELESLSKLDLSGNSIRMLGICSFYNLTSLQFLSLSHNKMTTLPAGIFDHLDNLLHLDLSQNKIRTLNQFMFINLTKLINLNLGHNKLATVKNYTFQGLFSLRHLSLRHNSLRYLPWTFEPSAFQGLKSLESFQLEGNQPDFPANFSYPDQALASIPTVRHLWLDGYPRQLGSGFSRLVQLTNLTLAGTNGGYCSMDEKIPSNFFIHLISKHPLSVNMAACSFKSMSPELFKPLPNIYSLDLSLNERLSIKGFEIASRGLENSTLTILNITDIVKPIEVFSVLGNTSFRYLKNTNLKVLSVENCKVIVIKPQAILDLPQTLEYLNFRDNKLINSDALFTLTHLINLRVIDVSKQLHNHAEKPKTIPMSSQGNFQRDTTHKTHGKTNAKLYQRARKLQSLSIKKHAFNLSDNNVKRPRSTGFCGNHKKAFPLILPIHLQEVYASDIKVTYSIPEIHIVNNKVLKYLDFSANNISCFGGPINGAPSLHHLDLSKNFCLKLNPLFFHNLPSLRTLLLNRNMLGQSFFEDVKGVTFSALINLETLDLGSNVIHNLPETMFENNKNLKVLNLSHNVMSSFRPNLENNQKLERLDISYNLLIGLSKSTCGHLLKLKKTNPNFTTHIGGNHEFLCDCDQLHFLRFLLENENIFEGMETFQCHLMNGSILDYGGLSEIIRQLGDECTAQIVFVAVLTTFFVQMSCLVTCALYYFKRWQWKYLYYLSKSRLHIGSTLVRYRPAADVFITYDQENRRLRSMMKNVFRPRLHKMGLTTVLGEVDFQAGPKETSIAGAVTSTGKTLVFLSPDIFQDYYRQLEVNLAIMHELQLRSPVLVPVLLLRDELLGQTLDNTHQRSSAAAQGDRHDRRATAETSSTRQYRTKKWNDFARFKKMLTRYPPEIATFLRGQIHRCLVYVGDTEDFWQHLRCVILEHENNMGTKKT